jgi:hypothetical protein
MCVSCMSGAEAAMGYAVAGVAMSKSWLGARRRRRLPPEQRARQERRKWDQNAAFFESLGHDPVQMLGPRPAAEPADSAPARSTAGAGCAR